MFVRTNSYDGLFKRAERTTHVLRLHDDGLLWLHTGDLGCMDSDGWVYFKQRIKE